MKIIQLITISLVMCVAPVASADENPQEVRRINNAGTSMAKPGSGRFSLLPYRDTIVMLDTSSGATWILKDTGNDSVSWSPIRKLAHEMTDFTIKAQAASSGNLQFEVIPELGIITLRGSKDDVLQTMDALKRRKSPNPKVGSEKN